MRDAVVHSATRRHMRPRVGGFRRRPDTAAARATRGQALQPLAGVAITWAVLRSCPRRVLASSARAGQSRHSRRRAGHEHRIVPQQRLAALRSRSHGRAPGASVPTSKASGCSQCLRECRCMRRPCRRPTARRAAALHGPAEGRVRGVRRASRRTTPRSAATASRTVWVEQLRRHACRALKPQGRDEASWQSLRRGFGQDGDPQNLAMPDGSCSVRIPESGPSAALRCSRYHWVSLCLAPAAHPGIRRPSAAPVSTLPLTGNASQIACAEASRQ